MLDRYRYNPKREHFQTKLSYIIDLINISEIFYDSLKSTYENISRKEIIDELINKLIDYLNITDDHQKNNQMIEQINRNQLEIHISQTDDMMVQTSECRQLNIQIENKQQNDTKKYDYKHKYQEYYQRYKERRKEYYIQNKDKIKEKNKEYYNKIKNAKL